MYYADKSTIATQYDLYYKNGKESLYNKRFGNKSKITIREKSLLRKHLELAVEVANKEDSKDVKVLDFGCGDGRTLPALYIPALYMPAYDFTIIAYDISQVGLEELAKNLRSEGFVDHDNNGTNIQNAKFINKNVTIQLVLGTPEMGAGELQNLLGIGFHLVLCLFGVLSHIPGSENRLEIIKMFHKILVKDALTCISLPTLMSHNKTANHFQRLRKSFISQSNEAINHLAKEDGDIYYRINGTDLYNFYHLYSMGEVSSQLGASGFNIIDSGIYSILLPSQLCKNKIYNLLDFFATKLLSYFVGKGILPETIAKYLFVTAKK